MMKLLFTQMLLEHRLSALPQLHFHSRLNTWLQWIEQRQLQDEEHSSFGRLILEISRKVYETSSFVAVFLWIMILQISNEKVYYNIAETCSTRD